MAIYLIMNPNQTNKYMKSIRLTRGMQWWFQIKVFGSLGLDASDWPYRLPEQLIIDCLNSGPRFLGS